MGRHSKEYINAYYAAHKEERNRSHRKHYAKTAYAPNHNKEWTDTENRLVLELYEKVGAPRLGELLKRSTQAIHRRHYLLTRPEADDAGVTDG